MHEKIITVCQQEICGEKAFKIVQERDIRKYNKCKENGVKFFYISFEKSIPDEYHDKIYTTTEELITAIEKYIENVG